MKPLYDNWWAIVLRGVAAIVFGIALFAWPGIGLALLVALFGAYAFVDGIFSLAAAVRRARGKETWGTLALVGVTGILAGLATWFWPGITALTLTFLIGAWAIITGVLEIVAAVELRKVIRGEFWMGLAGALSILFGILLFLQPGAGALAVIWLIGAYALVFGISLMALGFRLRGASRRIESHA